MKAQDLYDWRDRYGFASGRDLHDFFLEIMGDPSPSGRVDIPLESAVGFIQKSLMEMAIHSPSTCQEVMQEFIRDGLGNLVIEAAQFAMSPEGHKPSSGAMGRLKAAVAAYNEAQEQGQE